MPKFLKVVRYQDAYKMIRDHFPVAEVEYTPLEKCNRRLTAVDLYSPEDIPAFNRTTVDGYAVRAEDTFGSSESLPGMLTYIGIVEMGQAPQLTIGNGECAWIPTGGMLPPGSNAAVMVEYSEKLGDDLVLVSRPVAPGENIMSKGEDIKEGAPVFSRGKMLQAKDIGLLASLGIDRVPIYKPYRIAILSTGDEIIPINETPRLGQVRDVNSYSIAAAVEACGALPQLYPLVKDDFKSLQMAVQLALQENDVVILSGGSSVGVADYSIDVMLTMPDSEMLFHGIAVKPGKPTIGVRAGKKLIIGLPGHPVSALMVFNILCAPIINPLALPMAEASVTINIASQAGRDDFVPVELYPYENGWQAQPLMGKSGLMSILAQADGFIHIAYEKQGIRAGELVRVNLFG